MPRLLYISVSPRGELSASIQAAQVFLDALPEGVANSVAGAAAELRAFAG